MTTEQQPTLKQAFVQALKQNALGFLIYACLFFTIVTALVIFKFLGEE